MVNAYVRRLAKIAPSEVVVNNLCPGFVRTGLDKALPLPIRAIMGPVRWSLGKTVEEGAAMVVYAAAVASADTNGKFLQKNEIDP